MATVAAVAQLGPAYAGEAIGYRVLDLARAEVTAFTTDGVAESDVPGTYAVAADVDDELDGFIVWGLAGEDLAEATFSLPDLSGIDLSPVEDAITAALAGAIIYAQGSAPDDPADWSIRRGDTVPITIATTIAPDAAYDSIWLTLKTAVEGAAADDDHAVLQVRINRPGGALTAQPSGLIRLEGSDPADLEGVETDHAEITSVDAAESLIAATIYPQASRLLVPRGQLYWDVQQRIEATNETTTLVSGVAAAILPDVTTD